MKTKQIVAFILSLVMCFFLIACGTTEEQTDRVDELVENETLAGSQTVRIQILGIKHRRMTRQKWQRRIQTVNNKRYPGYQRDRCSIWKTELLC